MPINPSSRRWFLLLMLHPIIFLAAGYMVVVEGSLRQCAAGTDSNRLARFDIASKQRIGPQSR